MYSNKLNQAIDTLEKRIAHVESNNLIKDEELRILNERLRTLIACLGLFENPNNTANIRDIINN